jgi:amidase
MVATTELAFLDATAQAALVRRGEITPRELVDAAIARLEAVNPRLNAVILPHPEAARALASSHDLPLGPFRGVPFLVKDLLCYVTGEPYHMGTRVLRDAGFVAPHDTYLAARLHAAGFVTLGRTNTPEIGTLPTTEPVAYGPTRNPWDPERSPGGSSGGSAAAVAAGIVPAAHGNDGGGSIRIPASACGLVGLKPTRGRTSAGPDMGELVAGLAVEGVLTRSVRDTAGILDAVAGGMPGDPYAAPPFRRPLADEIGAPTGRLCIGVLARPPGGLFAAHPDVVAGAEAAARLLGSLGHDVDDSHPAALDEAEAGQHFSIFYAANAARLLDVIGDLAGRRVGAEDVEPLNWVLAEMGRVLSAEQYLATRQWVDAWRRRVAEWWASGHDLLLTPTLPEPPVPLGSFTATATDPVTAGIHASQFAAFTLPFNLTGQPAISLPLHASATGLPIGVQLVAAYGREDVLVRIAAELEAAAPWSARRPMIHA